MPLDTEQLRKLSPNLSRFLEYEREIESSITQEMDDRKRGIEDEKRAREKKARRKRLKKMRATQSE
jgi:hypothetical protein